MIHLVGLFLPEGITVGFQNFGWAPKGRLQKNLVGIFQLDGVDFQKKKKDLALK